MRAQELEPLVKSVVPMAVRAFPWGRGKESVSNAGNVARALDSIPGSERSLEKRKWQPSPVFLPGKFHGQRSLVGNSSHITKNWTQLSD